jgi:hypothetical protein
VSWSPPNLRPPSEVCLEPLDWDVIRRPTAEDLSGLLGARVWVPWPGETHPSAAVLGRVVSAVRAYGRAVLHVEPEGGRGTVRVSRWKRAPPER